MSVMKGTTVSFKKIGILLLLLVAPALALGATISVNTTVTTVHVVGSVSKGSGTFVIDDPIDPENKLLYHSFVESPDVMNLYDGTTTLDQNGEATIVMPDYFLALNYDFRYLATPIGQPAPNLHVKDEIHRKYLNWFGPIEFSLAGGPAGAEVSWQVTGIRHDPFIEQNPIVPVVDKTASTTIPAGQYLFPQYEQYENQ